MWVWVAVAPFFLFHVASVLSVEHHGSVLAEAHGVWAQIFGFECVDESSVGYCRNFFAYTVPFVRVLAYSTGSVVGTRLFTASPKGESD